MTPGLERVTVAPGITALDSSLIVPPIAPTPCARAANGRHRLNTHAKTTRRMTVVEFIGRSAKASSALVSRTLTHGLLAIVALCREHRRPTFRWIGADSLLDQPVSRGQRIGRPNFASVRIASPISLTA